MISESVQLTPRLEEMAPLGFVSHESYFPWLEIGRTALLKKYGLDYRRFEAAGYFLPVLELNLKFRRPARYGDMLTVETTLLAKPGIRFRVEYTIRCGDFLLAEGHSCQGFVDRQGRPVRPPAFFLSTVSLVFAPVLQKAGEL